MPPKLTASQERFLALFDKRVQQYTRTLLRHLEFSEKVGERLRSRPLILALGCGEAYERLAFLAFDLLDERPPNYFYLGVDIDPYAISLASRKIKLSAPVNLNEQKTFFHVGDCTNLSMVLDLINQKIKPFAADKEYVDFLFIGHPELNNTLSIVSHLCAFITGMFSLAQGGDVMITLFSEIEKQQLSVFLKIFEKYFGNLVLTPAIKEQPVEGRVFHLPEFQKYNLYDNQYAIFLEDFQREFFLSEILKKSGVLQELILKGITEAVDILLADGFPYLPLRTDYQAREGGTPTMGLFLEGSIDRFVHETLAACLNVEESRRYTQLNEEKDLPSMELAIRRYAAVGNLDKIHQLILAGGDVNGISPSNKTALDIALEKKQFDILPGLRTLGAKIYKECLNGPSALRSANGFFDERSSLQLNDLQRAVKKPDEEIPSLTTTLRRHVALGHQREVAFLIERGVDINDISPSDKTALDFALEKKQVDMVIFLRERGAKCSEELKVQPSTSASVSLTSAS